MRLSAVVYLTAWGSAQLQLVEMNPYAAGLFSTARFTISPEKRTSLGVNPTSRRRSKLLEGRTAGELIQWLLTSASVGKGASADARKTARQ